MALDPKTLAKGTKIGVLDKNGVKFRATFNKLNKGGATANVTLEKNNKAVDVPVANLRGLQGRPSTGSATAPKAAPAPAAKAAPAATPKATATPAPKAAPKGAAKTGETYAALVERLIDRYAQLAELMNTVPDMLTELHKFTPEEAAPVKGKATKPAPMADAEEEVSFD